MIQPRDASVNAIGEVAVSVIVLIGGFILAAVAPNAEARTLGASAVTAALVFWFQRRSADSAQSSLRDIANGKLSQLLEAQAQQGAQILAAQAQQQSRMDGVVSLMSSFAKTAQAGAAATQQAAQATTSAAAALQSTAEKAAEH